MKSSFLILLLAAGTMAASAQTPAKPTLPAAKPATAAARPASSASTSAVKLPPGVKPVTGIQKTIFSVSLRYQDSKIGTGAEAVPNKLYKIFYTGYRASDGAIFDSTDKHPRPPVVDKDGKPVLGVDGKPQQGPIQPISIPIGVGNAILGFDQGFAGMKVGGKRRIFIPWQLAYGVRAMPDRGPDQPGIPAKSDLIFDVELVDIADLPPQQPRPGMMQGGRPMPGSGGMPAGHPPVGAPPTPPTPPTPGTAPNAASPNAAPAPPAPPTAAQSPQK